MKGTIHDVDAQRGRWLSYRKGEMLTPDAGDGFACGGLGRHADDLDLRLLFLPGDPDADAVPMDREALEWLKEPRQTPYGGPYPNGGTRSGARTTPSLCTASIATTPGGRDA